MDDKSEIAEGDLIANQTSGKKKADVFVNIVRGLNPEELTQSGTQKLILNDLLKVENRVLELEPYLEKYNAVYTQKCILDEKLSKTKKAEILYSFCISVGGIIIGLSKNFIAKDQILGIFMLIIGSLLFIGGLIFKNYK